MLWCISKLAKLGPLLICFSVHAQWVQTNGPTAGVTLDFIEISGYLFVNGNAGGIYRTNNGGQYWEAMNTGLPSEPHCWHLATNGTQLFATVESKGIYVSNDLGDHWTSLSLKIATRSFTSLEVEGDKIIAGDSEGGLYFSPDNGKNWTFSAGNQGFQRIYKLKYQGDKLWIGAQGLFSSLDNGITWQKETELIGVNGISVIRFNGTKIFAGGYGTDHEIKLFSSPDNGITWNIDRGNNSTFTAIYSSGQDVYLGAGFSSVLYSSDNGITWNERPLPIPNIWVHGLFVLDNLLFASTTEGIFISNNKGLSWIRQSIGIKNHVVEHLFIHDNILLSSTERQGVYFSFDQGDTWEQRNSGISGPNNNSVCGFYSDGDRIVIGTGNGVFASEDMGLSWQQLLPVAPSEDLTTFAGDAKRIVACNLNGCYYSEDRGATWKLLGVGFMDNRHLQISLLKGDTIIIGTYDELYISTTGGSSWNINHVTGINFTPTDIVFHQDVLYLSTWQGIFKSTTLGTSWAKLNSLPTNVVTDLFDGDSIFFAGTKKGLMASIDAGSTWVPINDQLDNQIIHSLVLDTAYAYVGTYGLSVYRAPISEVIPCSLFPPEKPILSNNCKDLIIHNINPTYSITWYKDQIPLADDHSSTLSPTDPGFYHVQFQNSCGTSISDPLYSFGAQGITPYNVVTRGNDGYNDYYFMPDQLIGSRIEIFDRWGKSVYKNLSYKNDWDAKDLSAGTYYYIIENECLGSFKGPLSILGDN